MDNEDTSEAQAILLHDIRAAMVNHSGLQHEVQVSLQQLTELLQADTPVDSADADDDNAKKSSTISTQIGEIFEEDIDQCLPMLQRSSEKLTVLLNRFVSGDDDSVSGDSAH